MKHLILACLLLAASLNSIATQAKTDPNINAFENALSIILPKDCVFSADFTQTRKLPNLPNPLLSSGTLFFSCDHGLILENKTPIEEALIYTKSSLHFRSSKEQEIDNLNDIKHNYLARFLLALLSNNTQEINKNFTLSDTSTENTSGIRLSPISEFIRNGLTGIEIKKMTTEANDQQTKLGKDSVSISIFDNKNNTTKISISGHQTISTDPLNTIKSACITYIQHSTPCIILENPYSVEVIDAKN